MQTKKRAKPVKFGSASNAARAKEKAKKDSAKQNTEVDKKEPKNETFSAEKEDDKREDKGVGEDFSSTAQTKDISEGEESRENVDLPAPQEEKVEVPEADVLTPKDEGVGVDPTPQVQTSEDQPTEEESKDLPIDKDGAFFSVPPDGYDKKKSMTGYFFIVAFVTFLLGLTFFAGIYYAVSNNGQNSIFSPQPTAKPTEVAVSEAPTEKPVDLFLYSIRVLNGTSVAGVAAKVRTELTDAGFKVGAIGNADKDDYEETQISAGKKVEKAYLDKLKEALRKSYTLGSTSVASGDADVVVTIGSASAK